MWKPISEAPKDGTLILVCSIRYYCPETASWRTYHPNAQGAKTWRTPNGNKISPTHFQELPPKPE
jgi:hypothetical protein